MERVRDMISQPAASAMSCSPSAIAWAAETTDCRPEPHSRSTFIAGVSIGMPAFTAAMRLR
jgi:hypothetical protein